MPDVKKVMISSTARDLPEHRKQVMDACLRQGMFPMMMEHLPAIDAEAISASLALVDEADIYVGIFAHRYGYVPKENNPQQISITEMEYDRAAERKIPRLIFIIDKAHPLADFTIDDIETGENSVKLTQLKKRVETEKVVAFFKSPSDLRAHVINSLSHYRERKETEFHYVSDIPKPPEIYIAHPYTLLQTRDLIGRQNELNLLTDWVAKPRSVVYQARIFNVVAIGGMGKSALTWKWFNDIAPNEMKSLAGRMWWSFYESDAYFENFIIRALAYVTGRAREDIEKNTKPGEREELLLATLDREPFLLVLDGLERILIAYARMDANRVADDDLDQQTANVVPMGLPESAAQSFTGQHRLRKTADPRAGNFLRRLARVRASRVLVSTRLYPADLQTVAGAPWPGSLAQFIGGLSDDDALNMWRTLGVSGSRDELLRLFHIFGSHPLLIQALAGEIAHYHRAPGDFDIWRSNHPDFDPFSLPLVQARSHILEFALRGINETARKVLHIVAAFRMPATYDTLAALLIGEDKVFSTENELDTALRELEDRGLLAWDKRGNRYDLHPIVRGVVWVGLQDNARDSIYQILGIYFESLPRIEITSDTPLESITSSIELYYTLVSLHRYDDAFDLLQGHLVNASFYRIHAIQRFDEMLRMLFAEGINEVPSLSLPINQAIVLLALGDTYATLGSLHSALEMERRAIDIGVPAGAQGIIQRYLAHILYSSGALRQSEALVHKALVIAHEEKDVAEALKLLSQLVLSRTARGEVAHTANMVNRIVNECGSRKLDSRFAFDCIMQRAQWLGNIDMLHRVAELAWQKFCSGVVTRDVVRASFFQGVVALMQGKLQVAEERLSYALTNARSNDVVEYQIRALSGIAELQRQRGDILAARELLDDVWEFAERGPYPLYHADALNVLAQIERDAGNTAAAIEAATQAYRKAWCDGPPFDYHWGRKAASAHLNALGAPEPSDLPPYDESQHEPMPEVEIDPPDLPVESDSTEE